MSAFLGAKESARGESIALFLASNCAIEYERRERKKRKKERLALFLASNCAIEY